ncbi:MAG TPA: hypothetical protein VFW08_00825, partial [bacterium]|nr:hypothetical protein [bacterium]
KAPRLGWILGLTVVSHWVLDFLVHRPDLPLAPGAMRVGLGLWNLPAASVALEAGLFVLGSVLYLRTTTPTDRTGGLALWGLVLLLSVIYIGSLAGPVPPNSTAIALAGLAGWLFVPWGYWIDRHRRPA